MKTQKPRVHGTRFVMMDVSADWYVEATAAGLTTASAMQDEIMAHNIVLHPDRVAKSLRQCVSLGLLEWVNDRDGEVRVSAATKTLREAD